MWAHFKLHLMIKGKGAPCDNANHFESTVFMLEISLRKMLATLLKY